MIQLLKSILALIGACFVSVLMFTFGSLYMIGYGFVMSKRAKKQNRIVYFLKFCWRIFDGCLAGLGHLIYQIAYTLDLWWNMLGEILEDNITHKEDTEFTKPNVSVSASVGKLEIDGDLNKYGKIFSKILNFAFQQRSHAKGAWKHLQANNENRKFFNEK